MAKQNKSDPGRASNVEPKPLTDEDRRKLFPNGPVSLKKLKQHKKQSKNSHHA